MNPLEQNPSPGQAPGLSSEAQTFPHLQPHSFADWTDSDPPEREWLVKGLIPMGTVTFISGDGGLGKTLLGQQLVMAAAFGRTWCGRVVQQTPSVAMFCEDTVDEIRRRAVPILQSLGAARDDPQLAAAHFLCPVGKNNSLMYSTWRGEHHTGYHTTEVYRELRAFACMRKARLLLIDSLHDVFTGNENFRPEARAFVQALARIAVTINGAVVVLAHPSMAGLDRGSGTSGSTAWNNAVRSRLYLTRPEHAGRGNDLRLLTTVKANYGRVGERIVLKQRDGVFAVAGSDPMNRREPPSSMRQKYNRPQ